MQAYPNPDELSIDQLALHLQGMSNVATLWKNTQLQSFIKDTVAKNTLCKHTTAISNTYVANADDPNVQHLGVELLNQYVYADEYLLKMQSAITTAIEMNRAELNKEREKILKIATKRSTRAEDANTRMQNKEKTLLARINVMPEDIVLHIKSYLMPTIILGAIAIPRFELHDHLYPIKMKYTKIVYNHIRKNIQDLLGMMNSLAYREVIRREDYNVLYARQPGTKKQQVTDRISEILYCYHLILNIVSKVQKPSPENTSRSHILCSKTTTMLLNELTYIYKFINFSAKQNKTQNKPAKKQSRREEQA
jgi:hypothetical protein